MSDPKLAEAVERPDWLVSMEWVAGSRGVPDNYAVSLAISNVRDALARIRDLEGEVERLKEREQQWFATGFLTPGHARRHVALLERRTIDAEQHHSGYHGYCSALRGEPMPAAPEPEARSQPCECSGDGHKPDCAFWMSLAEPEAPKPLPLGHPFMQCNATHEHISTMGIEKDACHWWDQERNAYCGQPESAHLPPEEKR